MIGSEVVTLVRHEAGIASDLYPCTVFRNASWFGRQGDLTGTGGDVPRWSYTVRIPAEEVCGVLPKAGDFMVRGCLESCESPADFADLEHFRVNYVADHRRGGGLQHIMVSSTALRGGRRV